MKEIRVFIIMLLPLTFSFDATAQQDQSFRINSVRSDSTGFYRSVYLYPQFANGHVLLKNKQLASALVNYNRLSGQMLFINPKGDTLEFADPEKIEWVAVSNDTFQFFDKAYIQKMTHYADGINLYKKETIRYNGKEKKSGYGGYSTTTAANSINKVSSENKIEKISVDENALYVPTTTYYLGSPSGKYLLAVKKNFEKLFVQHEKKPGEYLQQNKVNFKSDTDLLALLAWLQN
jgi:hypothetical protein